MLPLVGLTVEGGKGVMLLVIKDRLKGVQVPKGRNVQEIVQDINDNCGGTPQVQELLDTLDFLVERLAFTDTERFGA